MIIYKVAGGEHYCKSFNSAVEKGKAVLRRRYQNGANEDWEIEHRKKEGTYFLKGTANCSDWHSTLNMGCVIRPLELEE